MQVLVVVVLQTNVLFAQIRIKQLVNKVIIVIGVIVLVITNNYTAIIK
jgi:hypothetical protein